MQKNRSSKARVQILMAKTIRDYFIKMQGISFALMSMHAKTMWPTWLHHHGV